MSAAPTFVTQVDRYRENTTMTTTLHSPDEPSVRKPERARLSFLETIVGRRGSLRAILSQVEAAGAAMG